MVNQAQKWKYLKDCIARVSDKPLRNTMMAEFRKKANRDWGFNPDSKYGVAKNESVELDSWEQDLVKDIEKAKQYQVDTRVKKRKQTEVEFKARMRDFVSKGGKFSDLPAELQNQTTLRGYLDAKCAEIDGCMSFLENN